jgi:hypothetical protein
VFVLGDPIRERLKDTQHGKPLFLVANNRINVGIKAYQGQALFLLANNKTNLGMKAYKNTSYLVHL